jgi:ATP-binding cassette subfamily G (WHITE) protein 2 (SNQ2)
MMVTNASVCAWDGPTRGLDASTAVDYVRSIRVLSHIHRVSTFVSLYQVSESIYREFDKVLVIDQGRQVYFGPAKEARAYFESLGFLEKPRQTTADYLTGCTDPFEREYKAGLSETNKLTTPDQLEEAFAKSEYSRRLDEEMDDYRRRLDEETHLHQDFLQAVKQSKRYASNRSVYSIPFHLQVWAIMKRQAILKWQDKFSLTVSWSTSVS